MAIRTSRRRCPTCRARRTGSFRYCRTCGYDFEPDHVSARPFGLTPRAAPAPALPPPVPNRPEPTSSRPTGSRLLELAGRLRVWLEDPDARIQLVIAAVGVVLGVLVALLASQAV